MTAEEVESQPGDLDEPCEDRDERGELDDWAERGVLTVRLVCECGLLLLDRELDRERGDKVRDLSREPGDVERDRDPPPREGTEADEAGEWDLERLLLLLGGVRESDLDLDRLGDRL